MQKRQYVLYTFAGEHYRGWIDRKLLPSRKGYKVIVSPHLRVCHEVPEDRISIIKNRKAK